MSKRALHIIDAAGTAYNVILIDRNARMLCGKPLYYKTGRTDYKNKPIKAREATVSIGQRAAYFNRMRSTPQPRKCTRCFELAKLTPAERAQALVAEADRKHRALAKLKGVADSKKRVELEARVRVIEAARIDALVCLDAFERDGTVLKRCHFHGMGGTEPGERCGREDGHMRPCKIVDPPHVDLKAVLVVAVGAYKLEHKSSGDKLIVRINGSRTCRSCGWEGDAETLCGDPDCGEPLPKYGRASKRHVACRFCRLILGRNLESFGQYDRAFFDCNGALAHFPTAEAVDVWKHTVLCALRYLAGVETTDQDDAPVVTKQLPDSSFVLEHDR